MNKCSIDTRVNQNGGLGYNTNGFGYNTNSLGYNTDGLGTFNPI